MRIVMRHEARQVPSWLIFDVGQKMSASPEEMTVDILRPLAEATEPLFLEAAKVSLQERIMLASFVDAGFVDGVYRRDEMGRPSDFANLTISVSGRAHLAEAQRKVADKTSVGYVKNRWPTIAAWFFGLLSAFLGAWLAKIYLGR